MVHTRPGNGNGNWTFMALTHLYLRRPWAGLYIL